MTDPIADMLTRIRNASSVRKKEVVVPFSKIKLAIANILVREGYAEKVEENKIGNPHLVITLKYFGSEPAVHHLERLSKPGHRRYIKKEDIGKVLNGFGLAILSTPAGVLTDAEAKKANVGGELICDVY